MIPYPDRVAAATLGELDALAVRAGLPTALNVAAEAELARRGFTFDAGAWLCTACRRPRVAERRHCPCAGPLRRGVDPKHEARLCWLRGQYVAGPVGAGVRLPDGVTTAADEVAVVHIAPDQALGYPMTAPILVWHGPSSAEVDGLPVAAWDALRRLYPHEGPFEVERVTEIEVLFAAGAGEELTIGE